MTPDAVLSRLSHHHYVIIGRAGMDIYPDPPGTRTEDATHFFTCLGGSSANIAVALTRLGGQCDLVTTVSDDAVGRFCLNELDRYGIGRHHVRSVCGEYRTSLAVVESRVEDHQSVIYRNGAADFQMSEQDVRSIPFDTYGALITTGTVLAADPSRTAAFLAFDLARSAGLPLIFDLDYRPYSWPSPEDASQTYSRAGALCDIIVGNDEEFGFMAGAYDQGLDKARHLARETATCVIYKRGEYGAITLYKGQEIHTGVYPTAVLKPTGAGDSFMGGLIAGLATGLPIEHAVARGSACAALVVNRVGCAPAMPTVTELEAFMAQHPDPILKTPDTEQDT